MARVKLLLSSFFFAANASVDDPWLQYLKSDVLRFLPPETASRVADLLPLKRPPSRQQKIDHFVILMMENRAADTYFGCIDLPGFEGIKGHTLPTDPYDPIKGVFNVTCGVADYVCKNGPSYDTFAGKFGKDAETHTYPYSPQDDKYSALHGARDGEVSVRMFSPEQVPVKAALAKEFGVFNKYYTSVPSASSPNHLFAQSATSCGMQVNVLYKQCGGSGDQFPQPTIYDSMRLHNVSFGMYMNSTCGLDGLPCHGESPDDPDSASAISTPDVAMIGVARHKDRFFSQTVFYEQAANGSLPAFSWILPPIQACDHPCHDVAKGEQLLKDVYEALRAGPAWDRTMLFVTYDDVGGTYDHIVPPFEDVPADESPCIVPGVHPDCGEKFDFRRLGLRPATMLISPWVAKGTVFQEPKLGPQKTSQFDHTSISATIKQLFNLTFFLTKRDAWAGTFEELLLDTPRSDAPMHVPDAPKPASPWDPPPNLTQSEQTVVPQHCSSIHGGAQAQCKGLSKVNRKQERNMRMFAEMLKVPAPDPHQMTSYDADRWLASHWRKWMTLDSAAAFGPVEYV